MNDIEQKARDMVLEVLRESELPRELTPITREYWKALCRAIEQHEAFRQEVSDALLSDGVFPEGHKLSRFIIPAPKHDPLVEAMADCGVDRFESWADQLRAALEARGLTITTVEKD